MQRAAQHTTSCQLCSEILGLRNAPQTHAGMPCVGGPAVSGDKDMPVSSSALAPDMQTHSDARQQAWTNKGMVAALIYAS